jgi:hypothetical protein
VSVLYPSGIGLVMARTLSRFRAPVL